MMAEIRKGAMTGMMRRVSSVQLIIAVVCVAVVAFAAVVLLPVFEIAVSPGTAADRGSRRVGSMMAPDLNPRRLRPLINAGPAVNTALPVALREATTSSGGGSPHSGGTTPDPVPEMLTVAEKAIADLLGTAWPPSDIVAVKNALSAVDARRYADVRRLSPAIADRNARLLVTWYYYRSFRSGANAEMISRFLTENPYWPERKLLRRRAEEWFLFNKVPVQRVSSFFEGSPPQTAAGKAALALVHMANGQTEAARSLVADAWRHDEFGTSVEAAILEKFKPLLTEADHRWRLDHYLLDDDRYGRPERLRRIRRLIPLLGKAESQIAKARLTVWRSYGRRQRRSRLTRAGKLFAALPRNEGRHAPSMDWGLEFHLIQKLRREGKDTEAWRRLLRVPTATKLIVSPDDWWIERRINAYNALYKKKPRTAYQLVAKPGDLTVNTLNEASFMAGWIALRFLNEPETALRHFKSFAKTADGPRTRSQSQYWLGRTYRALKKDEAAIVHFKTATKEFNVFYGQLALQTLSPGTKTLEITAPAHPSAAAISAFTARPTTQAIAMAQKAGHRRAVRLLITGLRKVEMTPEDFHLLAELAKTIGDTQMSLRVGKTAMFHGFNLVHYAYPIHAFPHFKPLRPLPERAMLFALARQESEFNTLITSIAGARGVLQVMQVTARSVCRTYRLKCGSRRALKRRLSADPAYNATLASAYVGDRSDEFGGSYILTFASYNAGPGRARYWIRNNGDPRSRDVDPVDWIELIHIKETRDYVKKVMANLQIYRARLGESRDALRIVADINRAR